MALRGDASQLKAGVAVTLAFVLKDAQNCAREVMIPELKIRKELPLGQPVVVRFTVRKDVRIVR